MHLLKVGTDIGCYVVGECLGGAVYVDFEVDETPEQCHEFCINADGCNYWTHYGEDVDDYGCFAYANCPEFSADGCDDCVSGEQDCPLQEEVIQHVDFFLMVT